ncbi:2416_t:CDS:1, partial [Entrophospora sp. SA101]
MSTISERLTSISTIPSQKDKTAEYRSLLDSILSSADDDKDFKTNLETFVDHIVHEQVGHVISRQVLSDFTLGVDKIADRELKKQILHFVLNKVQPRLVSFEEQ